VVTSRTFLAVDWGTTNRRVFVIEGGRVARSERDDRGVTAVRDFAAEAAGDPRALRRPAAADGGDGRVEYRLAAGALCRRPRRDRRARRRAVVDRRAHRDRARHLDAGPAGPM
jgi:hypothetical protein